MDTIRVTFSAKGIFLLVLAIIATLSVLHVIVMLTHYRLAEVSFLIRDLFDLDEEQSFGTWFSAALLATVGFLALVTSSQTSVPEKSRIYWRILGFGFCFLSLDEVVGLHETLNTIAEFSWTEPAAIIVGAIGLAYIPFFRSLPVRTRWLFILAGVVYLGGALGVERATDWYADEGLLSTLEYNLTTVLEEAMEMMGVTIILYAVLEYASGPRAAVTTLEIQVG